MPDLTIGEVARRAGVATSSIRYYERIGLLPEPDRLSGQRRYDAAVLGRLGFIGVAQSAGFKLREIKALVDGVDSADGMGEQMRSLSSQSSARSRRFWSGAAAARARACRTGASGGGRAGCEAERSDGHGGLRRRRARGGVALQVLRRHIEYAREERHATGRAPRGEANHSDTSERSPSPRRDTTSRTNSRACGITAVS